ncbi:unnamed protein product [Knipowitschia caucasica]
MRYVHVYSTRTWINNVKTQSHAQAPEEAGLQRSAPAARRRSGWTPTRPMRSPTPTLVSETLSSLLKLSMENLKNKGTGTPALVWTHLSLG